MQNQKKSIPFLLRLAVTTKEEGSTTAPLDP
jgi:hypothetical protein